MERKQQHQHNLFVAGLLLLLSFVAYSNSLHNPFLIDDHGLLFADPKMQNPKFLINYFLPNNAPYENQPPVYYRPFAHVLPMICHYFFADNPLGYHLVNLILFWIGSVLLYQLVSMIVSDRVIPLLTSSLWVVHPINGLLVNYITAIVFLAQIIFMLLSMMWGIAYYRQPQKYVFLLLSAMMFLFALFCHETSMAFPFYLMAATIFLRNKCWRDTSKCWIPFGVIILAYFLFRMEYASLKTNIFDKIGQFHMPWTSYAASFSQLVLWYISQLVSPKNIVLIFAIQPVRESLVFWNVVFWGLVLTFIMTARGLIRKNAKLFFLTWLAIGFLPVSLGCLIRPAIGVMIEPHWLFFPTIGFFGFLACVLTDFAKKMPKWVFMAAILFILGSNIFISRQYNRLWGNEIDYCRYWLRNVPGFKSVMFYLASAYMKKGIYDKAKYFYHQAIASEYFDFQIYCNLGLMAYHEKDFDTAMDYFQKALQMHPHSGIVKNNIGLILSQENEITKAKEAFREASYLAPFLLEPRLNLAGIYRQEGNIQQAIKLYQENLQISPYDPDTLINLLAIYLEDHKKENALATAKIMLKKIRKVPILVDTGSLLAQTNLTSIALGFYQRALILDANNKEAYLELGKLLGNLGKFDQAIEVWQEGLRRNPQDQRFKELMVKARSALGARTEKRPMTQDAP